MRLSSRTKAMTFLEIIVVVVIFSLVAVFVVSALVGGFTNLKQAEYKSRAVSFAALKMKQYMARSYYDAALEPGTYQGQWQFNEPDYSDALVFSWTMDVTPGTLKNPTTPVEIPYKNLTLNVSYADPGGARKEIRLKNTMPYPYIHTESVNKEYDPDDASTPAVPAGAWINEFALSQATRTQLNLPDSTVPGNGDYEIIPPAALTFDFKVPKDLLIMVNLVVKASKTTIEQALPHATIWTRFLLDGVPVGPVSRTPILTQPFISVSFGMDTVPPGPHTMTVQWCKDINTVNRFYADKYLVEGKVTLKEISINAVAYESKTARDYKP